MESEWIAGGALLAVTLFVGCVFTVMAALLNPREEEQGCSTGIPLAFVLVIVALFVLFMKPH